MSNTADNATLFTDPRTKCLVHVELRRSESRGYRARTLHNAASACVTVAFAVNFETSGEHLTRQAAQKAARAYLPIDLETPALEAARMIWVALRAQPEPTLNIAGNGLATLSRHGWTQQRANAHVYEALRPVHEHLAQRHRPLARILTGGQTGIDMAGAVAGAALGVPTVLTMPQDLRQRDAHGVDAARSEREIFDQIVQGVAGLPDRSR